MVDLVSLVIMDTVGKRTVSRWTIIIVFVGSGALSAMAPGFVGQRAATKSGLKTITTRSKYSSFEHSTKAHRIDCASCHKFPSPNWNKVRDAATAFPDITEYPKHESCLRCHTQQFFRGSPPAICSVCHTNPSPRDSSRHPYPNPREIFDKSPKGANAVSDFVVGFPHDKHIEIVAAKRRERPDFVRAGFQGIRRAAEESCSVCHQTMSPQDKSDDEYLIKPPANLGDAFWLKKGTFKTAPIGHTECFTCHSADSGIAPLPNTCSACHQLRPKDPAADFDAEKAKVMMPDDKVMLDAWRNRHSAGTFRHEWFSHAEVACATCHNVLTINTADPETTHVGVTTCAACHATATSDDGGAMNFEVDSRRSNPKFECAKCHVVFGRRDIPVSHLKAVEAAVVK
jgi:hypothetical protein